MNKLYIITKYVHAQSINEAIKKAKNYPIEAIFLDNDSRKTHYADEKKK